MMKLHDGGWCMLSWQHTDEQGSWQLSRSREKLGLRLGRFVHLHSLLGVLAGAAPAVARQLQHLDQPLLQVPVLFAQLHQLLELLHLGDAAGSHGRLHTGSEQCAPAGTRSQREAAHLRP